MREFVPFRAGRICVERTQLFLRYVLEENFGAVGPRLACDDEIVRYLVRVRRFFERGRPRHRVGGEVSLLHAADHVDHRRHRSVIASDGPPRGAPFRLDRRANQVSSRVGCFRTENRAVPVACHIRVGVGEVPGHIARVGLIVVMALNLAVAVLLIRVAVAIEIIPVVISVVL